MMQNKKMHPSGEVGRFQMDNLSSPPGDFGRRRTGDFGGEDRWDASCDHRDHWPVVCMRQSPRFAFYAGSTSRSPTGIGDCHRTSNLHLTRQNLHRRRCLRTNADIRHSAHSTQYHEKQNRPDYGSMIRLGIGQTISVAF